MSEPGGSAEADHEPRGFSTYSPQCPTLHRLHELKPPPQRAVSRNTPACLSRVPAGKVAPTWHKADDGCHHHLPRNSVLCRLLAAMIVLLVFLQAVSCGLFFCVQLPFSHRPYVDYRDLISELDLGSTEAAAPGTPLTAGQAVASAAHGWQQQQLTAPKLIPRVIHQTYRSARLPATAKQLMRSWQERNGEDWQVRFYSDEACLNFVRREFPEYFESYMNLPKDVERADFFRYMVVLRLGGVYADIDVECRQPLDGVIQPADTLLVGWDAELPNQHAAAQRSFARQRQVATWFFAAAPGHPVLRQLCDHIARNAMTVFSNDTVRDTLERTGQGIWSDLVLRHALEHPAAKRDDPWKVRILPRVAFGVHPSDDGELGPHLPGVVVLHHFLGRWQGQGSWARYMPAHRKALQIMSPLLPWVRPVSEAGDPVEPVRGSNVSHYPVSVDFYPPFTMMVDLIGAGDKQADVDVSAAVTAHGTWQPAVAPYRRPAVVEALVGALSRHSSSNANSPAGAGAASQAGGAAAAAPAGAAAGGGSAAHTSSEPAAGRGQVHRGVLVDVGAGHGFFSLAAAARGHRVIAFETSPGSLAAFKASIAYNGFRGLLDVRNTVLGSAAGKVCLQRHGDDVSGGGSAAGTADADASAGLDAAATAAGSPDQREASSGQAANSSGSGTAGIFADAAVPGSSRQRKPQQQHLRLLGTDALLRRRRGYPHLADEGAAAEPGDSCAVPGQRQRLSDVLANTTGVAVLRISAHGHEGWVVQGALDFLHTQQKPDVVYIEFCPAAMRAAGYSQPKQLLQQLFDLGYTDVAHAGRVCDQRWFNVTHVLRLQGTFSPTAHIAMQQPTWCKLRPENFQMLVDHSDPQVPENVLFVLGQPTSTGHFSNSTGTTQAASTSSGSSHNKVQQSESGANVSAATATAAATSAQSSSGQGNSSSSSSAGSGSSEVQQLSETRQTAVEGAGQGQAATSETSETGSHALGLRGMRRVGGTAVMHGR